MFGYKENYLALTSLKIPLIYNEADNNRNKGGLLTN